MMFICQICYYVAQNTSSILKYRKIQSNYFETTKKIESCLKCEFIIENSATKSRGSICKPSSSHHCKVCDNCVGRMDHHCPFIQNCVGFANLKSFVVLLFWGIIANVFVFLELLNYLDANFMSKFEFFFLLFAEFEFCNFCVLFGIFGSAFFSFGCLILLTQNLVFVFYGLTTIGIKSMKKGERGKGENNSMFNLKVFAGNFWLFLTPLNRIRKFEGYWEIMPDEDVEFASFDLEVHNKEEINKNFEDLSN